MAQLTKARRILFETGVKGSHFSRKLGVAEGVIYRFVGRKAPLPVKWREPLSMLLGVAVEDIMDKDGMALLEDEKHAA